MKYQIVLQHSEEDCGAACIATVAKYYKRTFAVSRVREAVGTGARGTSLLGLRRGAEALGFNARQVKASPQMLDTSGGDNEARVVAGSGLKLSHLVDKMIFCWGYN